MPDIDLKPCPFCGGRGRAVMDLVNALVVEEGKSKDVLVECRECGALGPPARSRTRAIASWNRRAAGA